MCSSVCEHGRLIMYLSLKFFTILPTFYFCKLYTIFCSIESPGSSVLGKLLRDHNSNEFAFVFFSLLGANYMIDSRNVCVRPVARSFSKSSSRGHVRRIKAITYSFSYRERGSKVCSELQETYFRKVHT